MTEDAPKFKTSTGGVPGTGVPGSERRARCSTALAAGARGRGPDPDGDGDATPGAPGPAADPAVTAATTGSTLMTDPGAPLAAAAQAVKTATTGTTAEADTPQKCWDEPTCQNGRRPGEIEASVRAAPDATVGVTGSAILRPGSESVIPNGCAQDHNHDMNCFPGCTGHRSLGTIAARTASFPGRSLTSRTFA
jgi:hypothetical protein